MKLCLILPYWGKLPNYFDLWLKSCELNPTIDWLIITDNEIRTSAPNIKTIKMNFHEVVSKVQRKIKTNSKIPEPYKLCDYKPAYGYIFEELLYEYDFWGYCDCDLIFGDIRKFMDDKIFLNNDLIQIWGHMTFIRNNKECNEAFMCKYGAIDFEKIVRWPIVGGFDEFGIPSIMKNENLRIYSNNQIIADILPYKTRLLMSNDQNVFPQLFTWENGRVFRYYEENGELHKNEYMYIHLQKRYLPYDLKQFKDNMIILITSEGIILKPEGVPTLESLKKYDTELLSKGLKLFVLRKYKTIVKLYSLFKTGNVFEFISFRKQAKKAMSTLN